MNRAELYSRFCVGLTNWRQAPRSGDDTVGLIAKLVRKKTARRVETERLCGSLCAANW